MAKLGISTGTTPNDGTGDNLLAGAVKINSNFNEIYTRFGDGTNLTSIGGTWTSTSVGIHTLKNVGIGTTNPRFLLEVGAVGASGTTLFVNGNARVTGILTIGTASITLNGATNIINVGTGITINGSTGIISATSIVLGGTTLTGAAVTSITAGSGISVNQSTGNVTITATGGGGSSQWVTTVAGIHTLSNVGIGTTNPTSALTVKGNTSLETLNVTGVSTFGGNINVSDKNILFGLSAGSSDDRIVWGTSSAEIYTNTTNLFLKTNLTSLNLQGEIISLSNYAGDEVLINASNGGSVDLYYNNSKKLETTGTGITVTGTIFTNQLNVSGLSTTSSLNVGTGGTVITTTTAGLVGIGTTNPTSALTVVGASGTTLLVTGGTIPIQIGGNGVSGTIFKVGGINLSGPDVSDVNATYFSNILYSKVGDFRYNLEFHSGGYTGYGGAAPAGGPGDFIFYKRNESYGRAERFRISGETGDITSQGGVIATSANVSGLSTTSSLNVGTGGTVITTTTAGLVGIGTTNPTSALTVGAVGSATTNLVVNGFAKIDQIVVKNNSNSYQDNIIMTQHPAGTFTGGRNVAIGDYSFTTPGAANENVAIGYYALNVLGNNDTLNVYSGNTALGCFSGQSSTYTLRNTLIGYNSGKLITIGDTNTILGSYDGNQNGLDIRTSDGNVVLSDGDGNIRFYANSSGNVGLGTTNPTEKLTVVGVTSSTLFYGDASYTTSGRWTLGASGTNDYTFTGIGFTQTTNDPVLYLARGRVYEFVNNSGGGHPFEIRTSNGGSAYSNGVTNNAAASGIIRFEIPFNAPNTLYYQCTNHSGMGNTISVYPSTL